MRRNILIAFLAFILLGLVITNEYMNIMYHTTLIEYYGKSSDLTEEELNWLEEHGPLIFGSDQSSPPLRYIDERSGQYKGLIIDYIRALSIELRHEIAYEPVEVWGQAFDSLQEHEKDFFDMIPSAKRGEMFNFTDPIYTLQGVIVKSVDVPLEIYSDLVNKCVAIPSGDYAIEFLDVRLPDLEIVETRDMKSAMQLLKEGQVDAVIGDEPVAVYLLNELEMKEIFETSKPLYSESTVLAVKKTDQILMSILNKGIFNLKKKNVMSDLQQKWFGITESFSNKDSSQTISLFVLAFFAFVGIMVYLGYSWNIILKQEVDKRTQELYLSRRQLKITLDGLTNPMVVINKQLEIINRNKIFCEFAKCKGKNPLDELITESHLIFNEPAVVKLINKTFSTVSKQRDELSYGGNIYVVSAFPVTDSQDEQTILVMLEDVTRIKIAEQKLLQNSKMKSVGILAAGVAHEIRNPLGLIGHYSYILKSNKGNNPERQEKAIAVIENSVERASNIIDNLLKFSRMTSEDVQQRNIYEFINNILLLENDAMQKKGILQNFMCPEDIDWGVRSEPLKHILINLISNAIDAVDQNGRIEINCTIEDGKLFIKIADNGIGIPSEHVDEIFMPFYTTKQTNQGTGLGLYIVYNEVTKYGGTIKVDSEVGRGTTFTLELPNQEDDK